MALFSNKRQQKDVPILIWLLNLCCLDKLKPQFRLRFFQGWVLLLTFLVYASYHMSRKAISVVKSELNPQLEFNGHGDPINVGAGWPPFNHGEPNSDGTRQHGKALLGTLDTAFLFAYAIGIFYSGHVADRSNLRYFLSFGMLGCGLLCCMLGLGYFWNIHSLWYFILVQVVYGVYQSTGWPCVVAAVGKWFPKGKRGLIMGIWNSHTSVGNILGSILPGLVLGYGWGWSFIVPGCIIGGLGVLVFLSLQVYPEHVDLEVPGTSRSQRKSREFEDDAELEPFIPPEDVVVGEHEAISLGRAFCIPGVAAFSFSLFFCKLVAYTFLFWLPYYIRNTPIGGKTLSTSDSAYLSTLFDVGGIIGGTLAGLFSDLSKAPGTVSVLFLLTAIPSLYFYREDGNHDYSTNVGLMMLCGILINGPYGLITTAVSADLGNHDTLRGNPKALATVTAIIDGTGSIGAAIGPFIAGVITNWNTLFYLLMGSNGIAAVLLLGVVFKEMRHKFCMKPTVSEAYVVNVQTLS